MYELGMKSKFLEGRFRANLALFHSDYSEIQSGTTLYFDRNGDGVESDEYGTYTNVGDATIKGGELELSANFSDKLYINTSLGYMDARYSTFASLDTNIAANRVFPNAPKSTASLGAQVVKEFQLGELSFEMGLDYQGGNNFFDVEGSYQGGYTLVSTSVTWESYDESWQIGIYGKNITGKEYRIAAYNLPQFNAESYFYGDPRTLSVSISRKFN